jgi:hypothetical protein
MATVYRYLEERSREYPDFEMFEASKINTVLLQVWSSPKGSRKLRFRYYMTTQQDGGKVVSSTHRPPLPPGNAPGTLSVRGCVDPRAIVRSERFYINEKFQLHQLGSNQPPI